jgi:carbon-monoxide dehydrogenase large subunit
MTIAGNDERLPLLTGRGRYLDDIEPAGCLHVAFLRSPYASARIGATDTEAAASMPGVRRVIVGEDLAGVVRPIAARMDPADWFSYHETAWPVIATGRVRFVGEILAAVVATSADLAEDACGMIGVELDALDPVVDARAATDAQASSPSVHEDIPDNVIFQSKFQSGADEAAFAAAPHRVSGSFRHPRLSGAPIECCGALATYDARNDVIELCSSTQAPHIIRDGLARCLDHPESRVHVSVPDVGGAFGVKMPLYPEEVIVAHLARDMDRPMKWTQDRGEHLTTSFHARDAVIEAELAADDEGRIVGLKARMWCDAGAYSAFPLGSSLEPHTALVGLPGPYQVPYFVFEGYSVATNKCPMGPYRGVGFTLGPMVTESLMDMMARRIGVGRAELRRRNMISGDVFPYKSASGAPYDSGDYPALLAKALDRAGYDGELPAKSPETGDGIRTGIGLACFIEPSGMGCNVFRGRGMHEIPAFDSARVRVNRSGSVEAYVTTPSIGQRPFLAMRQMLARQLGVPEDRIDVRFGDTSMMPYGSGTFASRSLVTGGGAIQRAGRRVIERMTRYAAVRFEVEPDAIVFEDGRFKNGRDTNQFATFEEIAEFAHSPTGNLPDDLDHGLQCTASYDNPGAAVSSAAHIAVVEVDTRTGFIRVVKYVVAEDCGPIANIDVVEGQIQGAVAQGIGSALFEEIRYDESGQLQSGTFADYLLPTSADIPDFEIVHQETPSPLTEGGYKGMGESGTIGAPAAIASAVRDALGLDWPECRMPFTPERILKLLSARD